MDLNDSSNSNSSSVSNSESSQSLEILESLNSDRLGSSDSHNSDVSILKKSRVLLNNLSSLSVNLGNKLNEFGCHVDGVQVEDGSVVNLNSGRVSHDDNLGRKLSHSSGRVLSVSEYFSLSNLSVLGESLEQNSNVVSREGLSNLLLEHFNRSNSAFISIRSRDELHSGFQDTGFDSSTANLTNSRDFVYVLDGES